MLTSISADERLASRRSIEALRAGVPNRAAVRHLGTDQQAIETRFLDSLGQIAAERGIGRQLQGFMVQGEFGTGKSHLLEWLQHISLEAGFACSRVVISKETPLGDPNKMFRAAIENLTLPDRVGGLPEVVERLRPGSQAYADLYELIRDPQLAFDPLFQATLLLHDRLNQDSELVDRIIAFWQGDRISVSELKKQLRMIGQPRPELRARRIQDLAYPRVRFAAQLIAAAGYTGWVPLLDEVELVASLSLAARERSYATLAALAGRVRHRTIPGLFMVGTVTTEFTGVVFEQRRDREKIPQRWAERDPAHLAVIEAGMEFLAPAGRRWMRIQPPRQCRRQADSRPGRGSVCAGHGWQPPPEVPAPDGLPMSMRQHVREWITRWDLLRLDPSYQPDIEMQTIAPDLAEHPDLERTEEDEGPPPEQ